MKKTSDNKAGESGKKNAKPANEKIKNKKATDNTTSATGEKLADEASESKFTLFIENAQNKITEFFNQNHIITRFIGLYLLFSAVVIMVNFRKDPKIKFDYTWHQFRESVNIPIMFFAIIVAFILLAILKKKWEKINFDSYVFVTGMMLFGVASLWRLDNYYCGIGMIVIASVLGNCFIKSDDFRHVLNLPKVAYISVIAVLALCVAAFIASMTVYQHLIFGTSTYDMGIFVQMYHSMSTKLTFETSCERENILSHFAVHCSPIYFLLLPFYCLWPSGQTLLIGQAVLVVSGVIPLYFICRKYNFSNVSTLLMCIVYIFSVSLISPCFYDFHENAFLPPLLMWFFLAIEKKKPVFMYIMMMLVLFVKEDAALYVMCISIYLLLSNRRKLHGFIMFVISGAYFIIVTSLMGQYGEGVMTSRTYGNLMIDYDKGFGEVIKSVITDPAYFISECFKEEKLLFILTMLLPLMFMPFVTKKISRLLLVAPFLLMNLATGYGYAFKVGYQYVFGTTACLIYVSVINLSDMDKKSFKRILPMMAMASVFTSVCFDSGRVSQREIYTESEEKYKLMHSYLDTIPEDASVLSTTWLLPHLAQREEVYTLDEGNYEKEDTCDFVVIHLDVIDEWKELKVEQLYEEGYTLYHGDENLVQIFVSPEYKK